MRNTIVLCINLTTGSISMNRARFNATNCWRHYHYCWWWKDQLCCSSYNSKRNWAVRTKVIYPGTRDTDFVWPESPILDWLQTDHISIGHYQHLIWHKIWFTSTCKKAIFISAALQPENVPEFQHDLPNAINNRGPLDNLEKSKPGAFKTRNKTYLTITKTLFVFDFQWCKW